MQAGPSMLPAQALLDAATNDAFFPADVAYSCLQSVPIIQQDTLDLLDGGAAWLQWQSDLAYLADPPEGYLYAGIDLLRAVSVLRERVTSGNITAELDLQNGLQAIVAASNDGHLSFTTDFQSVFFWQRSIGLYAMSVDGHSLPDVYVTGDVYAELEGYTDFQPSPVVMIDGYNATEYLVSFNNGYQDPDATYNSMFYQIEAAPGSKAGYFAFPTPYPGSYTTLTFQNGTTAQYPNYATSQNNFTSVADGPSFYEQFCNATRKMALEDSKGDGAKGSSRARRNDVDLSKTQSSALEPVVISDDQTFAAWILTNTANQEYAHTAVITMSEFTFDNTTQWWSIILAYEFMKELFPTYTPYFMRNYRAHPQFDVLGQYITNQSLHVLEKTGGNRNSTLAVERMSTYDASSFLDRDGDLFSSWAALYGPAARHSDNLTHLFTWDVSSVPFTTDYGLDDNSHEPFAITGYGNNVPAPPQPFAPENIVILSDGQCSSSCTSLTHVLKWQGKIKSIVFGGRPQTGPMAHPGGVKGATVAYLSNLLGTLDDLRHSDVPNSVFVAANKTELSTVYRLGRYLRFRAGSDDEYYGLSLANLILGSEAAKASIFADQEFTPLQFVYEAADCRMWRTKEMMLNREAQWIAAANQAFGYNNTTPWSGCVEGSYGHESSLSGDAKLYNGGKPNNVTDFHPPNEGNQPVNLAALGLHDDSGDGTAVSSPRKQPPRPTRTGAAAVSATGGVERVEYHDDLLALLVGVAVASVSV